MFTSTLWPGNTTHTRSRLLLAIHCSAAGNFRSRMYWCQLSPLGKSSQRAPGSRCTFEGSPRQILPFYVGPYIFVLFILPLTSNYNFVTHEPRPNAVVVRKISSPWHKSGPLMVDAQYPSIPQMHGAFKAILARFSLKRSLAYRCWFGIQTSSVKNRPVHEVQ